MEVVGARLRSDEHHKLLLSLEGDRAVRVEDRPAGCRARRGVEALCQETPRAARAVDLFLIEARQEQLLDLHGIDASDRLVLRDEALAHHVGGDLHGRRRGPLGRSRLQHVELAALDGELEVLRIAVMLLEPLRDRLEFRVRLRESALHLRDRRRRAEARDDVLTLGVREVLAVEDLLAGVGVARERDTRTRVLAHIPEDHRDDAARCAEIIRDLEGVPVVDRALPEPGSKHRLDGEPELGLRIGRKGLAGLPLHDRFELADEVIELGRAKIGIARDRGRLLLRLERVIEFLGRDVEHDAAEHRDEPPVGVRRKSLVLRQRGEALASVIVQPEVEDRVHHPGHAHRRARAHRDEERILCVAELLLGRPLDDGESALDLVPQPRRHLLAGREVCVAGLGRDREAGRDRELGIGHLGESSTLPTEEVAHLGVAFGLAVGKEVDPFLARGRRAPGRRGLARGAAKDHPDLLLSLEF